MGPRVGLPLDAVRPESAPQGSFRAGWRPDPVLEPEARPDHGGGTRRGRADALSIARLFEHMDPRPDAAGEIYRRDAYEDAPTITHTAGPAERLSLGMQGAIAAGATLSLAIVFVAGFLAAVLMLGERDPGGDIAIRTAPIASPSPDDTRPVTAGTDEIETRRPIAAPEPGRAATSRDLVPSANADRAVAPPPAPEVAAAQQARDSAIAPPSRQAEGIAAPIPERQAPERQPAAPTDTGAATDAGAVTETRVYPPAKPAQPTRVESAATDGGGQPAATALGAPGGNYSLQFGAFRDRANAEALLRELSGVARAGIAEEEGATGRTLFFVRAGAFRTRAEALQAVEALRRQSGHITFVHANTGTG